jgi:hypothetical protein
LIPLPFGERLGEGSGASIAPLTPALSPDFIFELALFFSGERGPEGSFTNIAV